MQIECYLIIYRPKGRYAKARMRMTVKQPSLQPRERAVKVSLEIPDALWEEPELHASIIVPETAVSKPVIDAQVLDNIQAVLNQQLGMSLQISVVENECEK